jgi:hypothetical protein
MNGERVQQIIRHFQENGLKQVLTNPANLRDVLVEKANGLSPSDGYHGSEVP